MEMDTLEEMARKRELREKNKTNSQEEVKKMSEEPMEVLEKDRKSLESTPQKQDLQKAVNPKHMVPYGNGSQEEQDEMEYLKRTNPALYASITSWN